MALKYFYLNGAILCAIGAPAFAQTQAQTPQAEDEIIVTGLRAVAQKDITSSVSILDAQELEIRNAPFLADQLRAVPGIGVSRSGAAGGLTQIRLRGAEANHTLVLLNGVEVSDVTTGETDFGLWSGLPAQRVEIARGEQSALYGSDAIGGVISITTGGDGIHASAEYGARDTWRGQAGYHGQTGALEFGLTGAGFTTQGVDTSGSGGDLDGSDSYSLGVNTALKFSPSTHLSSFTSYRVTEFEFDGFLSDADNHTEAAQFLTALTLNTQTGRIDHIARANYSRVNRENFTNDAFSNETIGQRVKLYYSPSLDFGNDTHGLTVSGLAEYESENYERVDTNTLFGDPNQNVSLDSFALGGELRGRLGGLALNGSLRFDDNDGRFDNATTWRLGAAYNIINGGKVRGSISTGIKNPTFTEIFGFAPANFIGNPDLTPERSQSWEIGYDQSFEAFDLSLTYFSAELEGEIFTDFSGFPFTAQNRTADSQRKGFEINTNWQVNPNLSLAGFISKVKSKADDNSNEIRVPNWTGSASLNWQSSSKPGLRAGLAADYVGMQDDFNFATFPAAREALSSYVLLSATAQYPISEKLALTLRGENLLDETSIDVFGSNRPGAGLFIGFKIQ